MRSERELGALGVVEDLRAGPGRPASRPAPTRRRGRGRPRRRTPRCPSATANPMPSDAAVPAAQLPRTWRPTPGRRARSRNAATSPSPRVRPASSKPPSSIGSSSASVSMVRVRSSPRNSSSSKSVSAACRSHGWSASSDGRTLEVEVAVTSALSRRLRITSPRCSRSDSPFLPVISSAWAMTLSRPSYCVDPLGGVALADPRHAREVVGGLADDRRELGIALRRHAVLVLDARRGSSAPGRTHRASGRAPSTGRSPAGASRDHR